MKRIMAAVAGLVLPALFSVAAATPAMADCPADTFCVYPSADYKGTQYTSKPTSTCGNFTSGIDNNANAMRNYRNHYVRMWDFPGCVGSLTYTANPLSYDSDFGNNGFTDKASSLKRI